MSSTLTKGGKATNLARNFSIAGVIFVVAGLAMPSINFSPMAAMLGITLGCLALLIGLACGVLGLIRSGGSGGGASPLFAWLAIVLGAGVLANTAVIMGGAGGPPIHDITTDTVDPPKFVATAKLRKESENPAEYSGPEAAAQQKEGYPDIKTLRLPDPKSFVFDTALQVVEDMGWELVASDSAAGTIEATAITPFVGFKDDVIIRLRTESADTLVDVRSKSRIGGGDMGVNAKRVRAFIAALEDAVAP